MYPCPGHGPWPPDVGDALTEAGDGLCPLEPGNKLPDAGDGLPGADGLPKLDGIPGAGPPVAEQALAEGHTGQLQVCWPGLPPAEIGLHVSLVTLL
jgi:hypothetical protein